MAKLLKRRWKSQYEGIRRQDRLGCDYEAYVPDPLEGWDLQLSGDVAADIADAETAVRELNMSDVEHVSLEGLARFLLRAESVASSYIEGLQAGARRLVEAEFTLDAGGEPNDQTAVEIIGNVAAMEKAVQLATSVRKITVDHILDVHRLLMWRSAHPEIGGQVREMQNWIGGSVYNPCNANFVPPPPEHVPALMDDLVRYVNGDEHSPLTQAAIAHAQFETIHPFADGNGRTGRALIHIILRRRSVASRFVPPVSLVLATWSGDYIAGLTDFRHGGSPTSAARSTGAHHWLRTFASATLRSCLDATRYADRIADKQAQWRERLGAVRAGSAIDLLLDTLPGTPLVTVESAGRLIQRSDRATRGAIDRLVEVGVLKQRNVGRQRYRVFEAPDVLRLFTGLERSLASPTGDTAANPPSRSVPARPPARG